ncbi:hypothetical protein QWA68_015068 [Fusarium oxysporum]|nr:hypothetical protein QWA68_015068 [Fusarium oxysporum]
MAAAIHGPRPSLAMVKFLVEKTNLNTTWPTVVQPPDKDEWKRPLPYVPYGQVDERIQRASYLVQERHVPAEKLLGLGISSIVAAVWAYDGIRHGGSDGWAASLYPTSVLQWDPRFYG